MIKNNTLKNRSLSEKFKFKTRRTNWKRELIGGLITFFAMVYILPVNQSILGGTNTAIPGHSGMPLVGIFVATAITAAISSIIIGLFSNMPIAIAPGMGSNAFFAVTMVKQFNMPWEHALLGVFIAATIYTILAITGVTGKFIASIPKTLKIAISCGLGLFITYIGLQNAGIVTASSHGLDFGSMKDAGVVLGICGILLVFVLANIKKTQNFSIFITMIILVFISLIIGTIASGTNLQAFNDISFNEINQLGQIDQVFGKSFSDVPGALSNTKLYFGIFALLFMTISGSAGTILTVGESAHIMKENGEVEGQKAALISTGVASMLSSTIGTTSSGTYLEANAGVAAGARTGIASITTGLLFALSIVLFPIFKPFSQGFVTAPALVYVGSLMFGSIKKIDMDDYISLVSSFVLIIIMVFAANILTGIAFGFITYIALKITTGKWKEINLYTYLFTILFLSYIITMPFII